MERHARVRRGIAGLLLAGTALLMAACAGRGAVEPLPLGEQLYRLVVGGPEIGGATLLRFYVWHVAGLSVPLFLLIVWHGFRVRRDGGISSPARQPGDEPLPRTERVTIVRGEVLTFFLTIAVLVVISVLVDAPIGPSAEPGALVEHSRAPWIFLWVQELLRVWPPAIAGVVTPLAVLLLLALLPYFDWSNEGVAMWFNRQGRSAQVVMVALFVIIVGLTVRAALR